MNNALAAKVELYKRNNFDLLVPPDFEKQKEALRVLTDKTHKYPYYGGAAGGGKSWVGWTWLIFNCLSYPETSWFFTREELNDARKFGRQTFNEVTKVYEIDSSIFRYDGKDNFYLCRETGAMIYLLPAKKNPRDEDFAALGSTLFTGGFMEECGQHPTSGAFETLKSRVGRYYNDKYDLLPKIYKTGNPAKNYTYREFYKPFKEGTLDEDKYFIPALVTDNPKRSKYYEEALNSITDKTKLQRLRFGNWEYDDDPAALMNYDQIMAIFTNTFVFNYRGGRYITADIALQGADLFTIGVWDGFTLIYFKAVPKSDAKEVEKIIRELAYNYNVPDYRIAYDADGLGTYLRGYLELAQPFVNGATPVKSNVEGSDIGFIKEVYKNLKAQCYFRMAKAVRENKLFISCDMGEYKDRLIEELEVVKNASHGTDKPLAVLPKEDIKDLIGRSPDISDMIMMRFFFTLKNHLSDTMDIDYYTAA